VALLGRYWATPVVTATYGALLLASGGGWPSPDFLDNFAKPQRLAVKPAAFSRRA
jgi:hypothetical protein